MHFPGFSFAFSFNFLLHFPWFSAVLSLIFCCIVLDFLLHFPGFSVAFPGFSDSFFWLLEDQVAMVRWVSSHFWLEDWVFIVRRGPSPFFLEDQVTMARGATPYFWLEDWVFMVCWAPSHFWLISSRHEAWEPITCFVVWSSPHGRRSCKEIS